VKSVIRALSSARFATPILPAQRRSDDVLTSARQSGRELFAEEPNSTNGNIGLSSTSVNQIPLNGLDVESEALPIFSSSVIGGGEEDFATLGRTGEVRSTVKQMRSVFGADPFSEPEIRSLLDGPTHFPFRGPQTPPAEEPRMGYDGWNRLPVALNVGEPFAISQSQNRSPLFRPRDSRQGEFGASEMGQSVRFGREDQQNVTQRDFKRPKERSRDRAYKARFSMDSTTLNFVSQESAPPPLGGHSWPREDGSSPPFRHEIGVRFNDPYARSGQDPISRGATPPVPGQGVLPSVKTPDPPFEVSLIFEGAAVSCRAWETMSVMQLLFEAGQIFGLDPNDIILVLFSAIPASLRRDGYLFGPPRVGPGSRVMVFHAPGSSSREQHQGAQRPGLRAPPPEVSVPMLNSKLLSTFKLPKFDGVARSWKVWEKSFQRFLGLHQLDYVLEEDFPELLWVTPGAKAANKMVFFLIEDAVATGTLASKLVRQATKWNGHEAFVLLRNGYVFNGPQTATILLAELSKIRLLRDEDASTFCLRLVELIEDLELVPGNAAVHLTDTQKTWVPSFGDSARDGITVGVFPITIRAIERNNYLRASVP
jgi:hypothetical protein